MGTAPAKAPVLCLMGTTATGKTALAIALSQRLPCQLISVDSALVYRGMDIGTAKPTPEERAAAPHALIDIRDPEDAYSAAQFAADAVAEINAAHARGVLPVLVGGTNLYFRALLDGFDDLPSADAAVRAALDAEAAEHGWPALHARLATLDPTMAERLHPNDGQRIGRALEIAALTGQAPSALQGRAASPPAARWSVHKIGLQWPVETLNARVEERFAQMMADGFLDEVQRLHARSGLSADHASMRAVGYRQLWAHIDGQCSLDDAVARGVIATRQFAKRQRTWLRKEQGVDWHDAGQGLNAPLQAALKWCTATDIPSGMIKSS